MRITSAKPKITMVIEGTRQELLELYLGITYREECGEEYRVAYHKFNDALRELLDRDNPEQQKSPE